MCIRDSNMLIDAIRNKDKRMYLRVIKAHISRIFNELDKLKGCLLYTSRDCQIKELHVLKHLIMM